MKNPIKIKWLANDAQIPIDTGKSIVVRKNDIVEINISFLGNLKKHYPECFEEYKEKPKSTKKHAPELPDPEYITESVNQE